MKRLIFIIASILLVATILGCSASGTDKDSRNAGSSNVKNESMEVPLVDGFPKEFPLIEGKITASMITNSVDPKEGTPTGKSYYTQIQTDLSTKEAIDFYKEKFTKIVKQEPAKEGNPALYSGFINKHPVSIYFVEQKSKTMLTIILSSEQKE